MRAVASVSTACPPYITTVRSAISATTPISWVMKRIDIPSSCWSSFRSSRICAWMVTSSAVVGSSAINSFGLQASAIAIITRWRMPPEKRCGCSWKRDAAAGMRTRSSRRMVSASAAARDRPRCWISASAIWKPMVSTGLRLVIGSWKIMATSLPRTSVMLASDSVSRSRPASVTRPSTRPLSFGMSRMMESAVTLLPEPDSPTIATVSLAAISNDTSRTTGIHCRSRRKDVVRPATDNTGACASATIGSGLLAPVLMRLP
ncbi:hypothetical protein ACVWXQ_004635 [Bradyrhizobium sp. S3.14.4]